MHTGSRPQCDMQSALQSLAAGMKHLFDGYAMLSKFRFEGGRVWAANKYVQTGSWKAFRAAGDKQQYSEFGTSVPLLKNMINTVKHYSGLAQGEVLHLALSRRMP